MTENRQRIILKPIVNLTISCGIFDRYQNPVLTREHLPPFWMYDADPETNPYMMQRLGVNAALNSGAIKLNGKYYLVVRVEGMDRKSFFAVTESSSPTDGFRFWDHPVVLPDTQPEETNVYDMRLTQHEGGWIYGVFCSESKDTSVNNLSAAVAAAGIVRTRDLKTWERLPNLRTLRSPQQRNVVLHPGFVEGKYAFYTQPMDDFIETGSGGGHRLRPVRRHYERCHRRGEDHQSAAVSYHHRKQERRRRGAHQDQQGLDPYRPRRAQHRRRAAAGPAGPGTGGRCEQRGVHQRRDCG